MDIKNDNMDYSEKAQAPFSEKAIIQDALNNDEADEYIDFNELINDESNVTDISVLDPNKIGQNLENSFVTILILGYEKCTKKIYA